MKARILEPANLILYPTVLASIAPAIVDG